jgi:hypothetical protein
MARKFVLTLDMTGGVQLHDEDDELIWSSDDADEFSEEFDDFVEEDETDDVIEWLRDHDVISESDHVEVNVEYGDDLDEEDDDD